ncbi:MAG: hypothetical protein HYY44_05800 [Deltaproteobacteria bacterium]|nr:hypothetical protein [Deltaproteobacteria bacterium]
MEYEINLLDYWKVIVKWKRDVAVIVLAVTIAAVVTSLLLPKAYRAEVKIMPVGGQSIGGIGTGLSRLGLDTLLGGAGMGGGSSMPLILFLRSRSLAEKIVERHDLREILFPESLREGRRGKIGEAMPVDEVAEALLSRMQFENNSAEQVLVISAEMGEPQLAADMANLYVKELDQYLVDNAVTVARRNRIFVGGQLERNKAEILEAGRVLAAFYASNRISSAMWRWGRRVEEGSWAREGRR